MKLHLFSEETRKWWALAAVGFGREWIVTGDAPSAPPLPGVPEAA